jgi:hypothetical protein
MVVFPIDVHTLDDPSTENTLVDPSPETGTETTEPVINNEERIVGGLPANVGQFPYQVLLLPTHQNYWLSIQPTKMNA